MTMTLTCDFCEAKAKDRMFMLRGPNDRHLCDQCIDTAKGQLEQKRSQLKQEEKADSDTEK